MDIGVRTGAHLSLADKFVEDPHTVVKAGDIVKVKVMEVDLQRKRIALSMLDEQPGEGSHARRGNAPAQARDNASRSAGANKAKPRNAAPAATQRHGRRAGGGVR